EVSGKQIALRELPGERDAIPIVLGRIGKAIDGTWDHVDLTAGLAQQLPKIDRSALDPFDQAGGAYWPKDADGMELRRANGRWIMIGSPEGPEGRHVIVIFADKL